MTVQHQLSYALSIIADHGDDHYDNDDDQDGNNDDQDGNDDDQKDDDQEALYSIWISLATEHQLSYARSIIVRCSIKEPTITAQ